jgi:RNA polymerase sigma factor (sigma-70 family)
LKNNTTYDNIWELVQRDPSPLNMGLLYQQWAHIVYAVALKYLKNKEDANDVVSEIFEKLMHHFPEEKIDNGPAWLHSVTKFHCLMKLRKENAQFRQLRQDPLQEEGVHQLEPQLLSMEKALQFIPEKQRLCLEQFFLMKKTYQAISEELGLTFNEIKSNIQNGKRNLRIQLEKQNEH